MTSQRSGGERAAVLKGQIRTLRDLAHRIRDEAENISPTNSVHPAPMMVKWADMLDDIAAKLGR